MKYHCHSRLLRTTFILVVAVVVVSAATFAKANDDCFCTGSACCPTQSEPKIRTACQIKELYTFLAQQGQTPLGKACSDHTGYAAVSCEDPFKCTEEDDIQNRMIFEDYISVSASIVISANTY